LEGCRRAAATGDRRPLRGGSAVAGRRFTLWSAHEIGGDVAEVRAEMVANVWKVLVSEGDQVQDGDTLVILESMKMEIPVLAEGSGTVSQLLVAEGQVVQEGDLIAVVA
jgi:biotin carboxyl carrier protein